MPAIDFQSWLKYSVRRTPHAQTQSPAPRSMQLSRPDSRCGTAMPGTRDRFQNRVSLVDPLADVQHELRRRSRDPSRCGT